MHDVYPTGDASPATGRYQPTSDIDLFSDDSLTDPYANYSELRALGGAVWLSRYDLWALPRYDTVLQALRDHRNFSSQAKGVNMTAMPQGDMPPTLMADEPLHATLRGLVAEQLTPSSIRKLETRIGVEAHALFERLAVADRVEVVKDIAEHLPLTVVTELVGVPEGLGEALLDYSTSLGNAFGPRSLPRTQDGLARLAQMTDLIAHVTDRRNLRPGSMGWAIFEAADRGLIAPEHAPVLMRDYIGPSLDTTIAGTGNIIWLLASNPAQWEALRADPALVMAAIDEGLRLESPIQYFTRTAIADIELDGVTIRAGERVLLMYGSANRDERKWADPEQMDIRRKGLGGHLAFGAGIHSCAGRGLARAEISAVIREMSARFGRLEIMSSKRKINSVFRSFEALNLAAYS